MNTDNRATFAVFTEQSAIAYAREQDKIRREHDQERLERQEFGEARSRYCNAITDHNGDCQYAPRQNVDEAVAAPYATITRAEFDRIDHEAKLAATNAWLAKHLPSDLVAAMTRPSVAAMIEVLEASPEIREREGGARSPFHCYKGDYLSSFMCSVHALRRQGDFMDPGHDRSNWGAGALMFILWEESQRAIAKAL